MKDIKSLSVIGNTICQSYITNPFLIDGYKFDLRIYVLITCCDPFRVYIYEEGLARFATCPYEKPNKENLNNVFMHLTNYSVQRNSEKFDNDEISGTKRRSSTIYEWFESHGYDAEMIWKSIDDVIIKTMLSANNSIQHHYSATFPDQYRTSACFELLGFDIILDDTLKPYVLEVNHSPSLETETSLDITIKTQLLVDIFNLITSVPMNIQKITDFERAKCAERLYLSRSNISARRASFEFRKILQEIQIDLERTEMENRNGFRVLYPVNNKTEKYQKFFDFNCENHRSSFSKGSFSDESEHKKYIDIQKDTFPLVLGKCKETAKLHKLKISNDGQLKQWKSTHFNVQPIFKDSQFLKPFNPNITLKQNEFIGSNRNSNVLISNSAKSLQKILSYKKFAELSKIITDKKLNGDQESFTKGTAVSCRSHSARNIRQNSLDRYSTKSPYTFKKHRKSKETVLHKVNESSLNQQTSVGLEWESSLSSNKIQYVSQFNFESQNKSSFLCNDDLKMFQKSPETTVLTRRHSFSSRNDRIIDLLNVFTHAAEDFIQCSENPVDNYKPSNEYNSLDYPNKNDDGAQTKYGFPSALCHSGKQIVSTYSNQLTNVPLNQKEVESFFSTKFNINSLNSLSSLKKTINNMGDSQYTTNDLMDNSEFSDSFSGKISRDSISTSDLKTPNALYAAEIEEYPDLVSKTKIGDTLKYFYVPKLKRHSLKSRTMPPPLHFAKSFDISKSIRHVEAKVLPRLSRRNSLKRSCHGKNTPVKVYQRSQTACKRKHFNSYLTCGFEMTNVRSNRSGVANHFKSLDNDNLVIDLVSIQSGNVDGDQNISSFDVEKMKYSVNTNDNRFSYFGNEFFGQSKEYNFRDFKIPSTEKDTIECRSRSINKKILFYNSKKRKPQIKTTKVLHQGASHCYEDTEENLLRANYDWKKKISKVNETEFGIQKSTINVSSNICEINISPSIFTDDCIAFNENYNFTVCLDSNQNSSIVCPQSIMQTSDKKMNATKTLFKNSESIYRAAMIQNKNSNHCFENDAESQEPEETNDFREPMRNLDKYINLCIENEYERDIDSFDDDKLSPQMEESNYVKWDPLSNRSYSRNPRFKLPEITLRGFNNIIHLLPHRRHRNKTYNLTNLNGRAAAPKFQESKIESTINYPSYSYMKHDSSNLNGMQFLKKNESNEASRSLLCQYLKSVSSKTKSKKPPKLPSSTKRLCKILTDKTNSKSLSKLKYENRGAMNGNLVLQYVNY